MGDIEKLKITLQEFCAERDWDKFHTPKNLIMALFREVGELGEIFQWKNDSSSNIKSLTVDEINDAKDEMADILIYLIRLADVLDVDLIDSSLKKIDKNRIKYPVNKSFGSAKKYTRL